MGAALPSVDGITRHVAERSDGRRALLEMAPYEGAVPLVDWLDRLVDEVEIWSDTEGFLRVLAAGEVPETGWVARVIEPPRGQAVSSLLGRPMLPARVVSVGIAIGRALASAHARGLVHGGIAPGHLHLRGDHVEIEPGGFRSLLRPHDDTRSADVEALGILLCTLMAGRPSSTLPADVPPELGHVIHDMLDPSPLTRPAIDQVFAALNGLDGRFGDPAETATPITASRTIAPRLATVDIRLPPAPPPAPAMRSVVPAAERKQQPVPKPEVPRWAVGVAAALFVSMVTLLVAGWWW